MTQNSFMLESVQQLTKIVAWNLHSDEYCLGSNIYFATIPMPILCHIIFNAIVLIDQLKWMDNYWGINLLIKDQKVKLFKAHASKNRLKSSMSQTGLRIGWLSCL